MRQKEMGMRRSADHVVHAIRDGIRNLRYTIRAEVDTPGAVLPKSVASIDLAPFVAVGSVVGTPALRAVDGLLTQVESLAADVIKPQGKTTAYPAALGAFFAADTSFSDLLYEPYKRMLQRRGARHILLSEHAFDEAQDLFRLRHGDDGRTRIAQSCAGLTLALAEARPIRKLDLHDTPPGTPGFMLAPNVYCAATIGLVTALVTRDPALRTEGDAVQDSVDSVVDARFDRFKRAMAGKAPAADLAGQFEALLPYLP
jgi:hypothetical protein